MENNNKKTIFSGVQPSGNLHLGNYLGAIKQWVDLQNKYNCIFCVVDYHAITVPQDPKTLAGKTIEIAKLYIASGIDPKKSIIFKQSDIKEHVELAWILNCTTARMSDLNKMTQFKDKAGIQDNKNLINSLIDLIDNSVKTIKERNEEMKKFKKELDKEIEKISKISGIKKLEKKAEIYKKLWKSTYSSYKTLSNISSNDRKVIKKLINELKEQDKKEKVNIGLFDYPVLMAADILLYNTDIVPVGDDQAQHVELSRTLARRFNEKFGETLKVPELKIKKEGARIMGLDDPTKKMSKSANSEANYIALLDEPEIAVKKIMKATTDSDGIVKYDIEKKPGISNLLTIYSLLENIEIKTLVEKYKNSGYGDFKKDLSQVVKTFLTNFQKRYNTISNSNINKLFHKNQKLLQKQTLKKIKEVKTKIGVL